MKLMRKNIAGPINIQGIQKDQNYVVKQKLNMSIDNEYTMEEFSKVLSVVNDDGNDTHSQAVTLKPDEGSSPNKLIS